MVFTCEAHVHLDEIYDSDLEPEFLVAESLGLSRGLPSPAMHVREPRASGKPYR